MVFENLIVYLLDRYLSNYIENLDTKKLKIDLWNGNVVLEHLFLKPNALADLNLPVTISLGYLEKLTLQVPWTNIYTNPTKATVDGLFLLIVPKTEVAYDPERDEKEKYEAKMREVQKVEELRKEKEAQDANKQDKTNDTLMERLQLQVIRNLELSIRNIHVVYEDKTTKPNHPFAFGFTLNHITLHTTTPNWEPAILTEDTPLIHKLGDLGALSFYWNTNVQTRSGLHRDEALKNLRERIAVDSRTAPSDISYILRPLNITAKFELVMKPRQTEFKKPMFGIKVELDEISLNINHDQYADLLDFLEYRDYLNLQSKYIKYHAMNKDEENRNRERWKFAIDAVLNEEVRPRYECYKWKNIKLHLSRCKEYRSLHFQDLLGRATVDQKQRAQDLEKHLDVFNLTYIRHNASIEAKKKKEQEPKTWWGSVSSWWGGNKPDDKPELDFDKMMTPEEKKKLYDAIGYEGEDKSTMSYPEEYVDIDMTIRLKLLDVNVWSKMNDDDSRFRVITRANIPDTCLVFKQRPATSALAVFVDLGSFQVFGIAVDQAQSDFSNESRPVLAQPASRLPTATQKNLLHVEFETKPLDKSSDYRIKVVSQSLEIKYNAPTINKLSQCFEQDTQRKLQSVKQAAYSTYTDVKHRSYILMKHNIEKIKVLDIDVDLESSYFLLPEKGIYQDGVAAICMDLGHLTLKRSGKSADNGQQLMSLKEAKDIDEARKLSYTQFKLKLEDIQLIFANQNESWEMARRQKDTKLHLIKPMQIDLDVGKCIYSDDAVLPAWKVAGNLPNVDLRLSDNRLFQIMSHMQLIPFPESKHPAAPAPTETETTLTQSMALNPEKTLEVIEGMTPVRKTKEKVAAEENKERPTAEKKKEFEGQLTQLEAMFALNKITLHIDENMSDNSEDAPFLCLTLESIVAKTKIKTFDMEFDATLDNLIVYHEQFVGKDNQQLRLLSAIVEERTGGFSKKLVSLSLLHTSKSNPSLSKSPYDGTENRARVHFSKLVVTLQLEALLSILRFQDSLLKRLPKDTPEEQERKKREEEKKQQEQKAADDAKNVDRSGKVTKKNEAAATPSVKIDADLEEFRIILASTKTKLFDVQVQGLKANVSQAPDKTLVNLVLTDLRVFDPYRNARYRKIISQQDDDKDLLRVDLSLFNYPEEFEKPLDVYDCDVKVEFAKATIVFLYKHIDALLGFLDSLNVTKAALNLASTKADAAYEQVQKLKEQAFKVHLDITFNAPNILVPTNSHSNEALFLDLGKLTLKSSFIDDPKRSLVEQQSIRLENILASRVRLDEACNILGEAVLIECAELGTVVNRSLFPEKLKTEPGVTIKVLWELVHFRLAKDDYSCVMKVLMENFSENIRNQIPENFQGDQYRYRQETQEEEEQQLIRAVIKKQKESHTDEVLPTLRFRAEIRKMALTLYLGESDLSVRRAPRNKKLKLASVQMDVLEAVFRQNSDGSYRATARVKNFLLDDLRETNKSESLTRMMDRHFTVDPNAHMFVASFDFKPKTQDRSMALRQLTAQLESLYICISLDYLMTLQDFFVSGLPSGNAEVKTASSQQAITTADTTDAEQSRAKVDKKAKTPAKPTSSLPATDANIEPELETRMDFIVKNPEIILLVDQHDINSDCLVVDLMLQMRMITVGNESKLYCWLKDLTVYSSNFAELKNANNSSSKVKYRILQPAKADVFLTMNNEEQKMDVRISDIVISIAPAAIRTVIGVTSSLGTLKAITVETTEDVNSNLTFTPQPYKDANLWFTKEFEQPIVPSINTDTSQDAASQQRTPDGQNSPKPMVQLMVFVLDAIDLRLEIGSGLVTQSVVAMCLSNITAKLQNWSSNMSLSTTINVEAALFNETMLAWEPLIEPTINLGDEVASPWCVMCSMIPVFPLTENAEASAVTPLERREDAPLLRPKQIMKVIADQLLNITITKSGLELLKRLSVLFSDVYNRRLPPADADSHEPMLSVVNKTGRELCISNPDGLLFENDPSTKFVAIKHEESVALSVVNEHQNTGRLSVLDERVLQRRQEFSVTLDDVTKIVSINRTYRRSYKITESANENWPVHLLCDTQIHHERRRIVLSSIIRIHNCSTWPLTLLKDITGGENVLVPAVKIAVNQEEYVPIDILYASERLQLFLAIDEGEQTDSFSFDWALEFSGDRSVKLKNGNDAHVTFFKEVVAVYSENTKEYAAPSFNIYIHNALHITNLLPFNVECSVDNIDKFLLKPSELYHATNGCKKSELVFTIPSYQGKAWASDLVDLKSDAQGDFNEYFVVFTSEGALEDRLKMKMVLRVDSYHEAYRLLLYSPFWILNRTNLTLSLQIDSEGTRIEDSEAPYLICPERFGTEASKKGQICIHGTTQDANAPKLSDKFSLDVIKSTGLAKCKVVGDRTYMICVDIATSSFGLTKLVTLSPAMVIINKSTVGIEVVETVADVEQGSWIKIDSEGLVPFWPRDIKNSLMRVRYADSGITSSPFKINQKHRMLLRMEDEERPVINAEVSATDYDGVKVIFADYKLGDAPLLVANCTENSTISLAQVDDVSSEILPAKHYVYYTWADPLKPRQIHISYGSKQAKLDLTPQCGSLGKEGDVNITYSVLIDGLQTVLLIYDAEQIASSAKVVKVDGSIIDQKIEVRLKDIGISIINDINREEILYLSLNKSKTMWTEKKRSRVKPLSREVNEYLEGLYQLHTRELDLNPTDAELQRKAYQVEGFQEVSFNGNIARLVNSKRQTKIAKRQELDGLWIEYAWSASNVAIHVRINRLQIDNQIDNTIYPVVFHPTTPKSSGKDYVEKPFIELSIYKSNTEQSNIQHFKYFKMLIQEFVVQIDQSFLVAALGFLLQETNMAAPTLNMTTDLEHIQKPLSAIIKAQIESPSSETEMVFDNIHLSPLKIHVSFSMHGSKPNQDMLAEYPLVRFLLQTLNVAEVQDVILRLGYYERKHEKFTTTKITNEVRSHYQNQLMKQIHVLVLGLDVLGNPLGVIRGLAEGVESFFYEPYKGAIEGPMEFAEGVATGVRALFGSAVGGAAGAFSKITSVVGKGLATVTFDDDYKVSRIRRKEPGQNVTAHIAIGGKNVVMGFVDGFKGVVTKPIHGAREGGASGFVKGLGKGVIGLVARPTGGMVDFASSSLDLIKRTAQQEEITRRVRYPRHVDRDGLVRAYVAHEATGFYILNRLEDENIKSLHSYVAHIDCSDSQPSWLFATSECVLFVTEISFLGSYEVEWKIPYEELKEKPVIRPTTNQIQFLTKEPTITGTIRSHQSFGKLVKFSRISDANYIVKKIEMVMHAAGL